MDALCMGDGERIGDVAAMCSGLRRQLPVRSRPIAAAIPST